MEVVMNPGYMAIIFAISVMAVFVINVLVNA